MLMGTRLPVLWRIESAARATAFWTNYLYHGLHAGHKPAPDANGPFKIFIVGTGRSGTHWLGHILAAYPSLNVMVEKPPIFPWVVDMARRPELETRLFPKLVRRYRAEHYLVLPMHYVDKSHPNLWLAERLAAEFPEARFVAIRRGIEATVASMMAHEGVRRWIELWDRDGQPSRFLGVDRSLIPKYRRLGVAGRCAVRVIAHAREIERLIPILGRRLHVIIYEDFFRDYSSEIERLSSFLGMETPTNVPAPKVELLEKWRDQLSASELAEIFAVSDLLEANHLLAGRG